MTSHGEALIARGLSPTAAARVATSFALAEQTLRRLASSEPATRWFVPGRIEVLGKHTDYCGGRSLLSAIEYGFCVVARPRRDRTVRVVDARRTRTFEVLLDRPEGGREAWMAYPRSVVRRMVRNFPAFTHGADVVFANDLPSAAGMSTSSALVTAIFLGLAHAGGVAEDVLFREGLPTIEDLAAYVATLENGQSFGRFVGDSGVGTAGGSQDHTAILCARPGALVQYSFCPVRFERAVALPRGVVFVIAVSGVHAEKTGAAREAYNRQPSLVRDVVARWNESQRTSSATLEDVSQAAGGDEALRAWVAAATPDAARSEWWHRVDQYLTEAHELVPSAGDALARGDLATFGAVVDRSQHLAETQLGNQIPETAALASLARTHGALAASAFGAGFGGGVWALVAVDEAEAFAGRWQRAYLSRFPVHTSTATVFTTAAGPGAFSL